jgi:hypothetical protein
MDARFESTITPVLERVEPVIERVERASQETAPVVGYLLTPVALAGYVLAFWRLAADLKWVGEFFINNGLFSHWQVWLALAIGIHMLATYLNRFGRSDDTLAS